MSTGNDFESIDGPPEWEKDRRERSDDDSQAIDNRTQDEIKETLDAILQVLEDNRDLLTEIKDKTGSGAVYGA